MKRFITLLLALSLSVTTILIPDEPVVAKAKPKLNKKKITLQYSKRYRLKVKNVKGRKVRWKTSNKKVVSVNRKGVLSAKKPGKAVITAKVNGRKLKCRVKVFLMTKAQKKAYNRALEYIIFRNNYSKQEIISQVRYRRKFRKADVLFAMKILEKRKEVNWKMQAYERGKYLLRILNFSKVDLIDMLLYVGFTDGEAKYALNLIERKNKVDWFAEAYDTAVSYMDTFPMWTKDELIHQLIFGNSFTKKQAQYAADRIFQ